MIKGDDLAGCPFLNGEVLDVDVSGTFGGLAGVCQMTAGDVVSVDHGRSILFDSKFVEDRSEVVDGLGAVDGCHEFCLGRACGDSWEPFCLVVYGRSSKSDDEGAGRSTGRRAGGASSIEVRSELI